MIFKLDIKKIPCSDNLLLRCILCYREIAIKLRHLLFLNDLKAVVYITKEIFNPTRYEEI